MEQVFEKSSTVISRGKLSPGIGTREKIFSVVCLILVASAEFSIIYNSRFGVPFHVVILFSLLTYSVLAKNSAFSGLSLTLTVVPLIRILSLSLPLTYFSYIMWFLIVSVPVFIAIFTCMIIQGLSPGDVGLALPRKKDIPIELGTVLLGLPVGILEYSLLAPAPLVPELSLPYLIAPVLIMVIYTGFVEELAFRGLMQYHALKAMGWPGIFFVTALFGIMHIGNLVYWDVLLAFTLGCIYAFVVRRTGSIYGASISHGLVNITLFIVAPLYF